LTYLVSSKEEQKEMDSPKLWNSSKNLLDLHNKLTTVVKSIDKQNFNAFLLDKASNYNPLFFILKYFYKLQNWGEKFNILEPKMTFFACGLQRLYHIDNSYHNSIHGADVT